MMKLEKLLTIFLFLFSLSVLGGLIFFLRVHEGGRRVFVSNVPVLSREETKQQENISQKNQELEKSLEPLLEKTSVSRPQNLKAVYATMHTAGTPERMTHLFRVAERTQINGMVIDIKDSAGSLAFGRLDVPALVQELHENNVYAIARIVVFQDASGMQRDPKAMIHRADGSFWRDGGGFAWLDPSAESGWEYVLDISKRAIDAGFDEINYDYIRFPSDGSLRIAVYPFWDEKTKRSEIIGRFAARANSVLKAYDERVVLSADIFGYTFLREDDLDIGQRLVEIINHFDFVYPMVYPSHYSAGNFGFENPAVYPYEVVKLTLDAGIAQLEHASSSVVWDGTQINPWLQSFDLGAVYTPERMRAQIQATMDGLGSADTGWLLWDPKNRYDGIVEYLAL